MSRKACCYDNAAMESFWATLKTECFHDQIPLNLKQAQATLFDYIETFTTRYDSILPSATSLQSNTKTTLLSSH